MARRGLALLELMIALVVGAMVVLLAYATLRGGMDTDTRVAAVRDREAASSILRTLVADGIRHASAAHTAAASATGVETTGEPQLTLVTRGLNAVQGAGDPWRVTLHTGAQGVVLDAVALAGSHLPLQLRDSSLRGVALRFRTRTDPDWRARWDDSTQLPDLIEIRWLDAAGRESAVPLLVRTISGAGA